MNKGWSDERGGLGGGCGSGELLTGTGKVCSWEMDGEDSWGYECLLGRLYGVLFGQGYL